MEQLLLLDIDGTLFDPEKFGKLIRSKFVSILGIDEEELIRANADYYAELEESIDFNPRDISSFMARRYQKNQEDLDSVFWQEEDIYKESLYPEVLESLDKLSKNYTLGIFSQGNEELQARKLEACGITRFINPDYVFIHRRKLSDDAIALLPRESTIVDDNHDVVLKLSGLTKTIWMNRRSDENDPQVRTIHSLLELV